MKTVLLLAFSFSIVQLTAQSSITAEISSDTILSGNALELKYTVDNLTASFESPHLEGLRILSGPNVSSSMQYINGKMSSSVTYSYILKPENTGEAFIGPAYFKSDTTTYETPPIEILTIPNPEMLKMNRSLKKTVFKLDIDNDSEEKPSKPKRKKRKI